jgi:hypothetical protein
MNRLLKVALPVALALVLFGAHRYVSAQETHSQRGRVPIPTPVFHVPPSEGTDVLATNHVLQRTYFSSGDYLATFFPAGFSPVDQALTVSCPGTTGTCTFEADQWVENGDNGGGAPTNGFAICFYIDGSSVPIGCFYTNDTPNDGTSVTGSQSYNVSGIPHGNHTVQTYLFTTSGTPVEGFAITYRVFKP